MIYAGHIVALGQFSSPETALSLSLVQLITITAVCSLAALPGGITLPTSATDWLNRCVIASRADG